MEKIEKNRYEIKENEITCFIYDNIQKKELNNSSVLKRMNDYHKDCTKKVELIHKLSMYIDNLKEILDNYL